MKRIYTTIIDWLERGDIVPLIVIVSAVHYAVILQGHDFIPVAIAIGLLVDLGHYRWVRAAVRYQGADLRERAARWALACGMTAVSLAYQQRFYQDWWYSIPLPLLIISLAWLSEKDKRRTSEPKPVITIEAAQAEPLPAKAERYICDYCGYEGRNQNGLNAHMRKHRQVIPATTPGNGRVK